MRNFIHSFTRKDLLWIIASACIYLLIASQYCPLSNDDIRYHFHQETKEAIGSFMDIIGSNAYGYMHVNGRFLVHVFVQFFVAWNLHWLFVVISALAFMLLLCSILYIIRREKHSVISSQSSDSCYILFFLIIFWPLMATSLYGTVAMTVNYLWSAAVYMFFIAIYTHIKEDNVNYPLWKNIVLFFFGLVCGSWQESFGLGVGGAICIYHLFNLRRTNKSTYFLIIGFGIGLCILLFAPGNFVRVGIESEGYQGVGQFAYQVVQLCKHNMFVNIWILLGLVSIVIDAVRKERFVFIKQNWLYFLSATIAFAFTLYTIAFGMMQGAWQLTILGVIDIILSIKFLQIYWPKLLEIEFVHKAVVAIICLFLGVTMGYRHVLQVEKEAFLAEFPTQRSDTAYDGQLQYTIMHSIPTHNEFIFERVCDMYCIFYGETLGYMQAYSKGKVRWKTTILAEPKELIIAHCTKRNEISKDVYLAPYQYYIVKAHKSEVDSIELILELEKRDIFYRTLDRRREKRYVEHIPLSQLRQVEDADYVYCIKRLDWWQYHHMRVIDAYCD